VLRHLPGAEQFRPQWRFIAGVLRRQTIGAKKGFNVKQVL
jgi:hypothetical protein